MQQKAFTLHNKGMNRDLSISKAGESAAYENHNIRIEARDGDTALSVTNERGNKEIPLGDMGILGELIGWNVLDSHIILFSHEDDPVVPEEPDHIYRIDYKPDTNYEFEGLQLFKGDLNFHLDSPIESVVYHETDDIQKIYWVDGRNVLRFMNFMAGDKERARWNSDPTLFNCNKGASLDVKCDIDKDYAGNTRPNGVIQYVLTYYNEHGQETGPIWVSDLVYLSPSGTGGAADGTNTCRVTITFTEYDTKFENYRVYSIFRSSEDGTPVSYIVSDGSIPEFDGNEFKKIIVIDDFANQTAEDSSRLLYLGSQPIIAGTLTHKDQTLFLGDIKGTGRGELYDNLEEEIKNTMRDSNGNTRTGIIEFCLENAGDSDLSVPDAGEIYPYENQLQYSSSKILTFKGGEKYRFALVFKFADGTTTDAFWIGDAENKLYPDMSGDKIRRVIAKCNIPRSVVQIANSFKDESTGQSLLSSVQLMIAEATYADRSIKAQGILCPTVFNVWERYNNRLYTQSSWIMRPRNSGFACRHFEPIHNSNSSTGEIDCNYWDLGLPTPYYQLKNYNNQNLKNYTEEFDGKGGWDYIMILYKIDCNVWFGKRYDARAVVVKVKKTDNASSASQIETLNFATLASEANLTYELTDGFRIDYVTCSNECFTMQIYDSGDVERIGTGPESKQNAWGAIYSFLAGRVGIPDNMIDPAKNAWDSWCATAFNWYDSGKNKGTCWFNPQISTAVYYNLNKALDNDISAPNSSSPSRIAQRWINSGSTLPSSSIDYQPSYYKKHLMFVDENVITLNSPEIENSMVSFDKAEGLKLRIVGVAKITSSQSDYVVDATPAKYPGENLLNDSFKAAAGKGNLDGLISWPLWSEYGVVGKQLKDDGVTKYEMPEMINRSSKDYEWGASKNYYWLHMWNHSGKINAYTDAENSNYSNLNSKVFATMRISAKTFYNNFNEFYRFDDQVSIRVFNYISGQYVGLNINGETKYYDANINTSLMTPGDHKYPVYYSTERKDTAQEATAYNYDLMLNSPVSIEYRSTPHAVIALPARKDDLNGYYIQQVLPPLSGKDSERELPMDVPTRNTSTKITGALLPWITNTREGDYPYVDFAIDASQNPYRLSREIDGKISSGDKYVYIGEVYQDYGNNDTRYGGITEAAIQNNRFIVAGPQAVIPDDGSMTIIGNRGDTYFQRWDCLKTKPYNGATNGVIDITSVMLETHINIDGRTDLQRGVSQLASIDYENFNSLNRVYSQKDTFQTRRDLDDDFNLDSYRSTLTWTLPKTDLADVDEWTHLTLASTLKLDGDMGICRALRRMRNSIIAFQDKGISEILFNSRTQLSTTDGVPVELANSGKVDGKRYITNKYGCINKWSIVEGKTGLYFIDNINKAFCLFNGEAIDSLSDKLGFGIWFKDANKTEPWAPTSEWKNMLSFYDREHSDIYLVKDTNDEMPCLVYNENLQAFTSFFDYSAVPMITNVRDRLVSFKGDRLWLQNEGLYCNFFDRQYDFWVQYRVTPDPFGDKLWTNFDYRADFYHLLDEDARPQLPEEYLINGDYYEEALDIYKEKETFTKYKVWNEYQTTGDVSLSADTAMIDPVRKKFRIWRIAIARALKEGTNKHGLDRIRNPWINILLKKEMGESDNQLLAQLHDIVVRYFE